MGTGGAEHRWKVGSRFLRGSREVSLRAALSIGANWDNAPCIKKPRHFCFVLRGDDTAPGHDAEPGTRYRLGMVLKTYSPLVN